MPKEASIDYKKLSLELDEILSKLETGDEDIDLAIKNYERGLNIVKQLERYLSQAENKITKLKLTKPE